MGALDGTEGKSLGRQAWDLVLYDIGFCLYVPTFIGSFCLGLYAAFQGQNSGDANCGGYLTMPSILLITFGILAGCYISCWTVVISVCGVAKSAFGKSNPRARDVQMAANAPSSA